MIPRLLYPVLALGLLMTACKPTQPSTTKQNGKYYEDLSSLRPKTDDNLIPHTKPTVSEPPRDPKTYVEPRYTVNSQVDAVLDSIDRINLTRKFIDGFTIQVHSGLKRDDALAVKKNLTAYLPYLVSDIQYIQPNFRVKAGRYFTRLEAQKDFMAVKRYFPGAIVVPDKIPVN